MGAAIIGVHRVIGRGALGRCGRGDEARVLGYPILKALRSMNHVICHVIHGHYCVV